MSHITRTDEQRRAERKRRTRRRKARAAAEERSTELDLTDWERQAFIANGLAPGLVGSVRRGRGLLVMTITDARTVSLRAWAGGDVALEAAVELLVRPLGGRLLDGLWIRRHVSGGVWFDADLAALEGGYLSGGERRLLAIASSLASSDHPVDLRDAITGIDPAALQLVLEALAHAGGAATVWPIARPSS